MPKIKCRNEIMVGRWAKEVEAWDTQAHKDEFYRLSARTPTYFQKNNTDNLAKWREFIKQNKYKPREGKTVFAVNTSKFIQEICLGKWAREVYRNAHTNRGHRTDWQYPETQQAEFDALWEQTPTYLQYYNAQKFERLQAFVAKYHCKPRSRISTAERKKISKERYKAEAELGFWAAATSEKTKGYGEWNVAWQYPEVQTKKFAELWRVTPTYDELRNGKLLEEFEYFCRQNGHRPRKTPKTLKSFLIGEVSQEEHELFLFAGNAYRGNIAFQYPEQKEKFKKIYAAYPTWREYMKRYDLSWR
ncbi:hypothetical protein NO2_1641 [Candidatus Termititenax persephonae]|uniref:Uncharacterized protein n=1 Tax=Candidatus Termititenax persephonae TaxID=2218525 RepID=A0A388TK41_9BACT|nr:hypothetical protein NO2_1641 [Candidatus Termititenax persephonae]